jgi:uncharacterized protein involved in exopolysaccharide biosynthesis
MEQEIKIVDEYRAILKRYKYTMMAIIVIGLAISIIFAKSLPSIYKSTATILIEQKEIPDNIVQSMVTDYAEQRLQIINKKLMSSENLNNIINRLNLYQQEREEGWSGQSVVDLMRENISMEMIGGEQTLDPKTGKLIQPTVAFSLSFQSESPESAQQVANELVSLYLNENIKQRAKIVEGATSFLEQETNKLRDEVSSLEIKLAKFKEKNAANLPEDNKSSLDRLDRVDQQIVDANREITSLTESELYLNAQLMQLDPNIPVYSATGQRVYSAQDRLAALKAEYTALVAKYSGSHPDVVKMRKEIAALQKEVGGAVDTSEYQLKLKEKQTELALLLDRYSPEHPDVKKLNMEISNLKKEIEHPTKVERQNAQTTPPSNSAYIQLKAQLLATQAKLREMLKSREALKAKVLEYQEHIAKAPEVEREYQLLMRDYENATLKYREVKGKQMEAAMAEAMEKNTQGDEFSLLEPPLLPEDPDAPNRKAIAFLGLLASIMTAIGFAIVKESLHPVIYTPSRLASIIGMSTLVTIPYLESEQVLLKRQKVIKITSIIIGELLVIAILWYAIWGNDSIVTP